MSSKGLSGQWLRRAGVLAALGATALLTATIGSGCESNVGAYCVARCDCQGCSEQDREDCTDDVEDAQKYAEYDGCASEFDDYISCFASEGTCANDWWITSTCAPKATLLRNCSVRTASFAKTPCQEASDKRQSCGFGSGSNQCDSLNECFAFCTVAATCDEIANATEGSTYANCLNACWGSSSSSSGGGP